MLVEIKSWCEEIVVAIILCIIIECLIPKGNNSKYVKVVVGIYIMYVTLNPILNLLNYDFDFKEIIGEFANFEETSNSFDNDIKEVYVLGIENNMKEELNKLGYEVEKINIFVDTNYENIEKIEICNLKQIDSIDKENNLTNYEIVKEWISKNYNVENSIIEFE